jgi:hypothetical protein
VTSARASPYTTAIPVDLRLAERMITEYAHVLGLFADIRIRHMVVIGGQDARLYAAPKSSPKEPRRHTMRGGGADRLGDWILVFVSTAVPRAHLQQAPRE